MAPLLNDKITFGLFLYTILLCLVFENFKNFVLVLHYALIPLFDRFVDVIHREDRGVFVFDLNAVIRHFHAFARAVD